MATRFQHFLLLGFIFAILLPSLGAQDVRSANNSADYSTTISQGSLFVIFGTLMGPQNLVRALTFPLPNVLSGTSVTVTSGSTTLDCPMIYTSDALVAAILPSTTPPGPATITVAYNGKTDPSGLSSTNVTVAINSVGIYTTTSSGLGAGIFTNGIDGTLKTFANSAKPGEIVIAWATGMGPISSPDNVLPTAFPNFPNVQVWVGGQSAQIYYAGRSGCCSGVDQIAFYVPVDVFNSCNVPVTIVSGGVSSNTVILPVANNVSGGPCAGMGPTLPSAIITKATSGQPVRAAEIAIGPTAIVSAGFQQRVVAEQLSAAFHRHVSEGDAAKLMKAYKSGSPKVIRKAMAKYASQWKALDARTKANLTDRISLTQEGASAAFGTYSSEGVAANVLIAEFPTPGSCVILPSAFPTGLGSASQGLDAGAYLSLFGAANSYTLKETSKGLYQVSFGSSPTGPNIPLGTYTLSWLGGEDLAPFSATVTVATRLAISNKSSLATVNRTQPLTVTWTGGISGNYVLIGGGNSASSDSYFTCAEDAGKGTFTIPTYILSSINATTGTNGIVWISPNPLSDQLTIPGIDIAYFTDGSSDSTNVTFK